MAIPEEEVVTCPKCKSLLIRYLSGTVSGEAIDQELWQCSNGCDALPNWVPVTIVIILLLFIAMIVWY